jgi:ribosomal protein S18 acetylase RimI-like enzyme
VIRKMKKEDAEIFFEMSELFYASDAAIHPIPQKYHIDTFNEIMRSNVYLEGYIFEIKNKPVGYAITTKTFSHEAGGITLWIDEIYVLKGYRSNGLGKEFFNFLKATLDTSVVRLRLEVETDNERAIKLYENMGFKRLEYDQMFKDRTNLA